MLIYEKLKRCIDTTKCYKCVKKKKKDLFLTTCECGITYCIKHRFHDCKLETKVDLPDAVHFKKIDKI